MSKKAPGVKETEQQRAMTEIAVARLADYKKRWVPLQQKMLGKVLDMGQKGSAAREKASGKASTDNAVAFGDAQTQLQGILSGTNTNPGSSKAKLAMAGVNDDQASSRGFGITASDQAIDDAYLQGLSSIAAMGKGQGASGVKGMQEVANQSGAQAQQDAEISANRRAGNAQLIGTVAGAGLAVGIGNMGNGSPDTGFGSVPGGTGISGARGNNPSAYVPGM
jgi:hypothetical protein